MSAATHADDIARKVLAIARTRDPKVPRLEFSRRCKHVAGAWKGFPYDPASDPIQHWIFEQLDLTREDGSRRWERFYWCAAPQFAGKTIVGIIIPLLHSVTQERADTGYALPTLHAIDKAWATKLKPQISESGFESYLPATGPGSHGGRGAAIQFRHPRTHELLGQLLFCTPGAYGDTVATMLVDEIDQFRINGQPDMEGLEDLWNRCNSYGNRALRVAVGTIEWDEGSTILSLIDQGTGTRPWLKCPHCERFQLIDPEKQLVYEGSDDATVRGTARLACIHCATKWTENDRQVAIKHLQMAHRGQVIDDHGRVDGPEPKTVALSLLEDAFVCPHSRLPELAREDWLSKEAENRGAYALRRKYFRYRLCKPYTEPAKVGDFSARALEQRSKSSTYLQGQVPRWVRRLTVGVDVQMGRHYHIVLGHGDERRWCIVDWWFQHLHPSGEYVQGYQATSADRHMGFDAMAARCAQGWARIDDQGEILTPVWGVIDVGYKTDEVLAWLAANPRGWVAGKGVGERFDGRRDVATREGASLLDRQIAMHLQGVIDVTQPKTMSIPLWTVTGSLVRQQMHSGLMREIGAAGSGELPKGLASNHMLLQHLTAEIYVQDDKGRWQWKQVRPGNHLLDAGCYALAGGWLESEVQRAYQPAAPRPRQPETAPTPSRSLFGDRQRTFSTDTPTTPDGRPWNINAR